MLNQQFASELIGPTDWSFWSIHTHEIFQKMSFAFSLFLRANWRSFWCNELDARLSGMYWCRCMNLLLSEAGRYGRQYFPTNLHLVYGPWAAAKLSLAGMAHDPLGWTWRGNNLSFSQIIRLIAGQCAHACPGCRSSSLYRGYGDDPTVCTRAACI